MKPFLLKASLFIMGLSGIIAQVLLLREFLVSFYGNELTLGIILANWLVLEAMGSFFVGKTVEKSDKKTEIFVLLQLVFSLALPMAIYFSRTFKNFLIATPGEAVGFASIFVSSILILLPVAIPHGALFTYGSKLYAQYTAQYTDEDASSIGKVYILETLGTILGGLSITYILIQYFNSFEIALMVSLLNASVSVFLLWPDRRPLLFTSRTVFYGLSVFLTLLYTLALLTGAERIHRSSIHSQWKEMKVLHYENSVYGNITVTRREEQFTFFTNGIPAISTPVPDMASIEDFVHFPMLSHERPGSVLILTGGVGGLIHEILKYPVSRIDYVELDPLLFKLVNRFSTPLTRSELSDPRVTLHDTDGRFFILRTQERFDLIFIGLSAPQELQTNRLFSSEFFRIAKQKMNPDGILVLTLPGSWTYLSKELKDLNGCILDTLKEVYPYVKIIPGDTNLYLASNSGRLAQVTAKEMVQRLEAGRIQTRLITRGYLDDRLHEQWQTWFFQSMEGRTPRINSDFRPLGVFFSLSYWNALFSPYLAKIFQTIEKFTLKQTLAILSIFSLFGALLFIKKPDASIQSVPYAIFTTGLTGMIFNLAIIFTFQTLYGYLYHQIGVLVAIFMMGIAAGSFFIIRRLNRIRNKSLLLLGTELGIILFSLALPFLFFAFARSLQGGSRGPRFEVVFWATSFLSGLFMGLQFPLATKIYLHDSSTKGSLGHAAGLIYGADLVGGFFGGLFGGVLLLPILGLKETCFLMALIKMSSFLLFFVFTKIKKASGLGVF
jgi:spermidine synthase